MNNQKIGILIDTAAGDDSELYKDTDIALLPLHIIFEDENDIIDTPQNLVQTDFYQRVEDGENVRTSQASPGELQAKYEEMLKTYDYIIHLPIPANLSSMYQTSLMIAKEFGDKVKVIEHSMAANGIKECALVLDQQLKGGKLNSIKAIEDFLKTYEKEMYLGIVPGDLKKLARGGRAVGIVQTILNVFKTKVLIKWEAKPKKQAFGRTIASVSKTAISTVKEKYPNQDYKLIFVSTPLTDKKIKQAAIEILEKEQVVYQNEEIPAMYTAHAGVNTIGFISVKKY